MTEDVDRGLEDQPLARPPGRAETRTVTDPEGADKGSAAWLDTGTRALLGEVRHVEGIGPKFYALVKQCALDARAAGHTTAIFTIRDERLLRVLQRTFTIVPEAAGRDPDTGVAKEWTVTVDLDDALRQLAAVT